MFLRAKEPSLFDLIGDNFHVGELTNVPIAMTLIAHAPLIHIGMPSSITQLTKNVIAAVDRNQP